jgi:hypothetical protein
MLSIPRVRHPERSSRLALLRIIISCPRPSDPDSSTASGTTSPPVNALTPAGTLAVAGNRERPASICPRALR